MSAARRTEAELLEAMARQLTEQGYDVIMEPSASLLPAVLQKWRPDAVALGRNPKLLVEIADESPHAARRVADIQMALKSEPDWKLHLVLNRAKNPPEIERVGDPDIIHVLDRAIHVAHIDARAALLMTWAAFEALSRDRWPSEFARPQSPSRLIERLASQGVLTPSDANFLRAMAQKRNSFVHGVLREDVSPGDVTKFVMLLKELVAAPVAEAELDIPAF